MKIQIYLHFSFLNSEVITSDYSMASKIKTKVIITTLQMDFVFQLKITFVAIVLKPLIS